MPEIVNGESGLVARNSINEAIASVEGVLGLLKVTSAGGSTILTDANPHKILVSGTLAQTIVLPVVSTLSIGHFFIIVNGSTGVVTVQSSGANLVETIAAGGSALVQCILTTGTDAASWKSTYFGTMAEQDASSVAITGGSVQNLSNLSIRSTDAGAAEGPEFRLWRNSASPEIGDLIAGIRFDGNDSLLTQLSYGLIVGVIENPADGAETGGLKFRTRQTGALIDVMYLDGDGAVGIYNITPRVTLDVGGPIATNIVAVSGLPVASTCGGARAMVNNSNVVAPTNFANIVVGGGANTVPVYSDGTNWRIG